MRHPLVKLDAYIDAFTLSATAPTEQEVEAILHSAAADLLRPIRKELQCDIAKDKTAVSASSDTLANKLAAKLSCHGAVAAPATASLGVDLTIGRKRSAHTSSGVRQSRLSKGLLRTNRLRNFERAVGGTKASKVCTAGAIRAAEYGAAVNGVSDCELRNMQSIATASISPGARGRCKIGLLAFNGDPTWQASVAPILQWIRIAWRSESRLKGETSIDDLRAALG